MYISINNHRGSGHAQFPDPGRWDSTAPCDAMPASHYGGMQPIWWADFCLEVGGGGAELCCCRHCWQLTVLW